MRSDMLFFLFFFFLSRRDLISSQLLSTNTPPSHSWLSLASRQHLLIFQSSNVPSSLFEAELWMIVRWCTLNKTFQQDYEGKSLAILSKYEPRKCYCSIYNQCLRWVTWQINTIVFALKCYGFKVTFFCTFNFDPPLLKSRLRHCLSVNIFYVGVRTHTNRTWNHIPSVGWFKK